MALNNSMGQCPVWTVDMRPCAGRKERLDTGSLGNSIAHTDSLATFITANLYHPVPPKSNTTPLIKAVDNRPCFIRQ